jgi:hypothetical protein
LHGNLRHLEPPDQIPALQVPVDEIGIIKETPAKRYLEGQGKWDRTFRRKAESIVKRREKQRKKINRLLERAKELGLLDTSGHTTNVTSNSLDEYEPSSRRRWGPLDLEDERPPPSAIAMRRDVVSVIECSSIHSDNCFWFR